MSDPLSLLETFESIPDPRDAQGRRYSLTAMLTLATVALFSGACGPSAIAQFAADRGLGFARALGFTGARTPCCGTFHYLFKALNLAAFEKAVRGWVRQFGDAGESISIDGKVLRGTQGHATPQAGTLLVTAFAHRIAAALAQVAVPASTNEHKKALQLLNLIPLKDKIVLGDAMFCQRDLSRKITEKGGDYVWAVKLNQPDLHEAIETALNPQHEKDFSPA